MDRDEAELLLGLLCLILVASVLGALLELALHFWPVLLALLVAWWRWIGPWWKRGMREAQEEWRHELARREIEQVYLNTVAAMSEVAALAEAVNRRASTDVERTRMDRAERRRHYD